MSIQTPDSGPDGALTGESERADEFIRRIGAYLYQSRRLRAVDAAKTDGDLSGGQRW